MYRFSPAARLLRLPPERVVLAVVHEPARVPQLRLEVRVTIPSPARVVKRATGKGGAAGRMALLKSWHHPSVLSSAPPFRDPRRPESERLDDLMARLSVDDLLSALGGPGLPSLPHVNISGTTFALECLAGLTGVNVSTSWPMPISLGATFDTGLVRRIAAATADEVRGHHNAVGGVKPGPGGGLPPYAPGWGLLCLAPGLNLYRDPRWGRNYESFGEDPLVISRMGVASIQGFSGDDGEPRGRPLKTAAVAKHFAAYSLECIDPNTFPTCGYSRASFDAKVCVAFLPPNSRVTRRQVAPPCCGRLLTPLVRRPGAARRAGDVLPASVEGRGRRRPAWRHVQL